MFNLLVAGNSAAWDAAMPWSMPRERFMEFSGLEAKDLYANRSLPFSELEIVPALIMYEWGRDELESDVVRYGHLKNIKESGRSIWFNFRSEKYCDRHLVDEFAALLGLHDFERHRTHWAVKDGDIPQDMIRQMIDGEYRNFKYEIVLSYAGENQAYVQEVATYLSDRGINVFFAPFREADLWGRDLAEEFDTIYRMEGRYCVMFLSKAYADKAWPTHERRSAMSRAMQQRSRYILPCCFDKTEVPGLPPSVHYVDLNGKTPEQLGELITDVVRPKRT